MSDRHLKILAMAARRSQRQLEAHDAERPPADTASAERRLDLRWRAARTRARLAAARARRL